MEQNSPVMVKKLWRLVRVMFFMLKKGIISKRKFLVDLNMMMKRGKIAGKAFHNLMFHHHPQHLAASPATLPGEYEFSCSNTPSYPLSLFSAHKKHKNKGHSFSTRSKPLAVDHCDDIMVDDAVYKVLNMLTASASPPLPGFGNTPMVEQLRITDSPFPVTDCGEDGDYVDEAAENFIKRERMEQNSPVMVKKVWSLMRVMFLMLKKGIISKRKFFVDLHMMMKRGKIAGKVMFHGHHNWAASTIHRHPQDLAVPNILPGEYEFSCSNTPPYPLSLFSTHKKHKNKSHHYATPDPPLAVDECDDIIVDDAVYKVLNMLTTATASPPVPEFRNSPMVEQMRIADSPFELTHSGEDGHVDEAAEKFIKRFYNGVKRENQMSFV
ncbi:hypothetical protein LXL04_032150 [Taraxacum kok-saghyz]